MDSNTLLVMIGDKLPKNDPVGINILKERLDKLSETQREKLMRQLNIKRLKDPMMVFWVGSVLCGILGVGRFMLGDTVSGIIRLIIALVCFACWIAVEIFNQAGGNENIGVIFTLSAVISTWTIIICYVADLFIVDKKLKNQNLKLINHMIDDVK